ncbi:unnamed protein product [Arabidopsis halleri]
MISDLPADLLEEILYRVPATSHKQLRSTCKLWNVLIKKNRRFTEKHFHEASKQSVVLMLDDHKVRSMNVNLNVSAPSIEFKSALSLKDSHSNLEQVNIARVFHCDGLLLCTTKENKLVVWNPYLGETRWIQLKTDYKSDFTYALGYVDNKSCRTYKILRLWEIPRIDGLGLEIYEFCSNSWRVPLSNIALLDTYFDQDTGVSLKGNTYWLTYHSEDFLLPFDFKTERFKCLRPPTWKDGKVVLSVVREEQLSLLYEKNTTPKMEIWITTNIDTEAEVLWSKSFTVDSEIQDPYTLQTCLSSLIDEEKKVVVCCIVSSDHFKRIRMYTVNIIGEDDEYYTEIPNEESLSAENDKYLSCRRPIIFNYVPSLVQI